MNFDVINNKFDDKDLESTLYDNGELNRILHILSNTDIFNEYISRHEEQQTKIHDSELDSSSQNMDQESPYYSCFISYSSKDEKFTRRLYEELKENKIHCWFAPEDMRIGDPLQLPIDEIVSRYDKLLMILSKNSLSSQWAAHEMEAAVKWEQDHSDEGCRLIFPIRIDDAIMNQSEGWPHWIHSSIRIGDFTHWQEPDDFQIAFARLLRDLSRG